MSEKVRLYTNQSDAVLQTILQDGICFSKREFIHKKYGESAAVFLNAYEWLAQRMPNFVEKPDGAELPYWAFEELVNVDTSGDGHLLVLEVPKNEVLLFDMFKWIKILQMKYVGDSEDDERDFAQKLKEQGVDEFKVMTTNFYPALKAQITTSWTKLFCDRDNIDEENSPVRAVQAALWCIKKSWIVDEL